MIFERYIDVQVDKEKWLHDVRIETDIPRSEIFIISPMINKYGAKFKNISILEDRYGNQYKVKGNYKDFIRIIRNPKSEIKGFRK
jgi:hypothetical protein